MTHYFTLNRDYADLKLIPTKDEIHIIPVLSTGEMGDRVVIHNDQRASWYIGNRFFDSESGAEVYTQDHFGGRSTIYKHVRKCDSSVLFTSTGKLVATAAIDSRSVAMWYSPVFGSAPALRSA